MNAFKDFEIIRQHVRRAGRTRFFSRGGGDGKKGKKRDWKKIMSWAGIIAGATMLAGAIATAGMIAWVSKDLPDPNNIADRNIAQTTKIYDRTGEHILYEVHGAQKRTVVELEDISTYVRQATIAAEDKDFYTHKGFDLRGIMRAVIVNLMRGGRVQGGSTITQQFIKNSVLTTEKTYTRKVKEVILSFEIERRFTKDEILKLYLNEIPYGSVAYGIESAAQTFFGKSAKDLTLSESALLTSLPKAPTYYSPYGTHQDDLLARQQRILDAMAEEGYITKEEAEEAKKDDVLARIVPRREAIVAPHFVFYVREMLADEFGEQAVERGGLKVITTLDFDKQAMAEKAITEKVADLEKYGANTAALLAVDPANGDVLAMVGSADYFNEEINGKFNSLLGKLQPGSSIKPMVYAAAFEKGYTPDTVVYDVETVFKNPPKDYIPHNYDGGEHGPVTLRQALAGSLNIPAVQVLYLTGIDRFIEFSRRFGYTTFDRSRVGLALVLGGAEVRPIEHITAMGAFARDGLFHPSRAILRVEDRAGRVLMESGDAGPGKRVVDAQVARQVNTILSDNAARAFIFGERNWLTLGGRPVAAKTGTTNNFKDAWAVGYTPSLVSGVWVGKGGGGAMKQGADGSKIAAPIWNAFMKEALKDSEVEGFPAAERIVTGKPVLDGDKSAQIAVRIDTISGKLATEHTPPEYVEERKFGVPHSILYFVDKDDPRGPQPAHPENDPQFANWEAAVAKWAEKEGIIIAAPPTEYDDVHKPENTPSVSFTRPNEGEAIPDRTFTVSVDAFAPRGMAKVEYALDEQPIGTAAFPPFTTTLTIPNRFGKGFHTLSATAFDDVGNRARTTVTINLTAEPGPLGIQWTAPWDGQIISSSSFPLTIKFSLDDPKSVSRLSLSAEDAYGVRTPIGSIEEPSLPNMAITWSTAPPEGNYRLVLAATLSSGDRRETGINIGVR